MSFQTYLQKYGAQISVSNYNFGNDQGGSFNSSLGIDWERINKGVGGFAFGNGIKTEIIDYAIRGKFSSKKFDALSDFGQNRKFIQTLGKEGTLYLKYAKGLGVVAEIANIGYSTLQFANNPTAGNATRLAVQGIAVGTAFIPGVGWVISLGIGTADAIWGDDFYNWIDNH